MISKKSIFLLAILTCLACAIGFYAAYLKDPAKIILKSAQSTPKTQNTILATLEDYKITSKDIQDEIRASEAALETPQKINNPYQTSLEKHVLSQLLERKIILSYAKKYFEFDAALDNSSQECFKKWNMKFDSNEEPSKPPTSYCESLSVEKFVHSTMDLSVNDDVIEAYYTENKKLFEIPAKVKIRQIVSATEKDAKKIQARVRRYNFASLARKESITPEASQGGLLPVFAKGEMPRALDIAFQMAQGKIHGIVKSPYGFHVLYLVKKYPKVTIPLKKAKKRIRNRLKIQKEQRAYTKLLEDARRMISVKTPSRNSL